MQDCLHIAALTYQTSVHWCD